MNEIRDAIRDSPRAGIAIFLLAPVVAVAVASTGSVSWFTPLFIVAAEAAAVRGIITNRRRR